MGEDPRALACNDFSNFHINMMEFIQTWIMQPRLTDNRLQRFPPMQPASGNKRLQEVEFPALQFLGCHHFIRHAPVASIEPPSPSCPRTAMPIYWAVSMRLSRRHDFNMDFLSSVRHPCSVSCLSRFMSSEVVGWSQN